MTEKWLHICSKFHISQFRSVFFLYLANFSTVWFDCIFLQYVSAPGVKCCKLFYFLIKNSHVFNAVRLFQWRPPVSICTQMGVQCPVCIFTPPLPEVQDSRAAYGVTACQSTSLQLFLAKWSLQVVPVRTLLIAPLTVCVLKNTA